MASQFVLLVFLLPHPTLPARCLSRLCVHRLKGVCTVPPLTREVAQGKRFPKTAQRDPFEAWRFCCCLCCSEHLSGALISLCRECSWHIFLAVRCALCTQWESSTHCQLQRACESLSKQTRWITCTKQTRTRDKHLAFRAQVLRMHGPLEHGQKHFISTSWTCLIIFFNLDIFSDVLCFTSK